MDWLSLRRKIVSAVESDLKEEIDLQEISAQMGISPFFLQKGFSLITGYALREYVRNRRLYQAAVELQSTNRKILDIALDYGYETAESFSKAFTRFHGANPSQVRAGADIRHFLPLKITITMSGGDEMKVKIVKMFPFKVIGFQRAFSNEDAYAQIPRFWDEICEKYAFPVYAGNPPANPYEKAIMDHCIGEYGICIDELEDGKFNYLIAGKYTGGPVPEGMRLYEFPGGDYAVFDCIGPIPNALQEVNTRIFQQWLPGNPDYELRVSANVEWYDCIHGEKTDADYHSAIWLPVKRKEQ